MTAKGLRDNQINLDFSLSKTAADDCDSRMVFD